MILSERNSILKSAAWALAFVLVEYLLIVFVDRPVASLVHDLEASQYDLIKFFHEITDLGLGKWYLWPCGLAAIICGFLYRSKTVSPRLSRLSAYVGVRAFFLFTTVAISGLISDLLKYVIGRPRPPLFITQGLYNFDPFRHGFIWHSMPSGHATTAFTLAAALSVLYPRQNVFWYAYGIVLGVSRVMIDIHYVSDVCAGAVLGILTVHVLVRSKIFHIWGVIFPVKRTPHSI